MNGATAELSARISIDPISTKQMTIGANHHFLRTFKNPQNSKATDILLIFFFLMQRHDYRLHFPKN
jgi:hypothetical protein